MISFKNKRILITQNSLHKIAGSEVNTLEFADFFLSQGADVTVYTLFAAEPMISYFKRNPKIKVVTEPADEIHLSDFDIIWVHQQILPKQFAQELQLAEKLPIIIFFYMSSSVNIELPYTRNLEENIASRLLFVSEEALNDHLIYRKTPIKTPTVIFPNPSPIAFTETIDLNSDDSSTLKRLLIVSNHPPEELQQASVILEKIGIAVTFRGESTKGRPSLVSPDELRSYDCIITIGKTVQYCLCLGIPVYVYDHFGGPGYLNENNFLKAAYHNFAGRGFDKKQADIIADEVIKSFNTAQSYYASNRKRFIAEYSIKNVINTALQNALPARTPKISDDYVQYLELTHSLVAESIINQNRAVQYIDIKNAEYRSHLLEIDTLNHTIKNINHKVESLNSESIRLNKILNTRSVRAVLRIRDFFTK